MESVQHSMFDGKQCIACLEWKPYSEYRKRKDSIDGYRNECKACKNKRDKDYVARNYDRLKEQWAMYRAQHREEHSIYTKQYYVANADQIKERVRQYQHDNRDTVLLRNKNYYQNNREQLLAKGKLYQESRKDFFRAYKHRWYKKNIARVGPKMRQNANLWAKNNRDRVRVAKQQRRAFKQGNSGSYTAKQWAAICAYYGDKCLCCGTSEAITLDHIIPLSQGGRNAPENVQPLCKSCNSRKWTQTIDYRPDKGMFACFME